MVCTLGGKQLAGYGAIIAHVACAAHRPIFHWREQSCHAPMHPVVLALPEPQTALLGSSQTVEKQFAT